ncbi:MAG: carboxypeptidase M32 [Deltaproteobacteria bacterium]|nr:carboxypeptidase M32 [Deltaproteobacteria bacterium]
MKANDAYQWLVQHQTDTAYLFSTAELAAWDQRTYIPAQGHAHRSKQIETLARLMHQRGTDPQINDRLQEVESSAFLHEASPKVRANIRMWRRDYDRQVKIPEKLASEIAGASSAGESVWESAMQENDWDSFFPHLEKLLSLSREKAECLGYANEPYDALLDEYEMGLTATFLSSMFEELQHPLVALLRKIQDSAVKPKHSVLHGDFPVSKQKQVCVSLVEAIGYSLKSGRIDESMHPFSVGIGPGDSRITTRYNPEYLGSGIFGCLHEAGHSLYELGLPKAHFGTPAGIFASIGVHESQSRLWENQVGRSLAFWKFARPVLDDAFSSVANASMDDLVLSVNEVKPGLIRVEADEVTYNLHVMLRFELERALFKREIDPAELPEVWSTKMEQLLGIRPLTVKEGAMQDVHWSAGMFGYFPTYSLGNLYAAQLFAAANRDLGDLDEQFGKGEFSELLGWLRQKVHQKGQCLSPIELIRNATGELPTSKYFLEYCQTKYSKLYQL